MSDRKESTPRPEVGQEQDALTLDKETVKDLDPAAGDDKEVRGGLMAPTDTRVSITVTMYKC